MEHVPFRRYAKYVGLVDTVVTSIAAFTYLVLAIISALFRSTFSIIDGMTKEVDERERRNVTEFLNEGKGVVTYYLASSLVDSFISVLQLFAAIMLINSTSLGRETKSALRLAYTWLFLNMFVVLSYFIWRIVDQNWITVFGATLYRVVAILIVMKYVQGLRRVSSVTEVGGPNGQLSIINGKGGMYPGLPEKG